MCRVSGNTVSSHLWKLKIIGRATIVKIFNSNVKAIQLYASESWTITQSVTDKVGLYKFSSINVWKDA